MHKRLRQVYPATRIDECEQSLVSACVAVVTDPALGYKRILSLSDDKSIALELIPGNSDAISEDAETKVPGQMALRQFHAMCQFVREDIDKKWQCAQIYIPVAVDTLLLPGFCATLAGFLRSSSASMEGRMFLDLRNIRPAHDLVALERVILSCMIMGVGSGLDGFGGGYADLNAVLRLPLVSLTFSTALIERLEGSTRAQHILARCIEIAHGVGAKTIADGVSSAAQVSLLRRLGCHQAKGPQIEKIFSKQVSSPRRH